MVLPSRSKQLSEPSAVDSVTSKMTSHPRPVLSFCSSFRFIDTMHRFIHKGIHRYYVQYIRLFIHISINMSCCYNNNQRDVVFMCKTPRMCVYV